MRSLPEGVPPINDLKKRRLLHLPSKGALPMLEHIVIKDARDRASTDAVSDNFISTNLDSLINEIDKVAVKFSAEYCYLVDWLRLQTHSPERLLQ